MNLWRDLSGELLRFCCLLIIRNWPGPLGCVWLWVCGCRIPKQREFCEKWPAIVSARAAAENSEYWKTAINKFSAWLPNRHVPLTIPFIITTPIVGRHYSIASYVLIVTRYEAVINCAVLFHSWCTYSYTWSRGKSRTDYHLASTFSLKIRRSRQ